MLRTRRAKGPRGGNPRGNIGKRETCADPRQQNLTRKGERGGKKKHEEGIVMCLGKKKPRKARSTKKRQSPDEVSNAGK